MSRKARNYLATFLRYDYKVEGIPFKDVDTGVYRKIRRLPLTVRRTLPGSIHTPIKKLKRMNYTAFKNGRITNDKIGRDMDPLTDKIAQRACNFAPKKR